MKRILLLLLVLGAVCSLNAKTRKCLYRVTVTGKRAECPVVIRDVPEWAQSAVVSLGGVHRIPSQLDRELDELVFVSDISGDQNFQVLYSSDPDKRVFKNAYMPDVAQEPQQDPASRRLRLLGEERHVP